MTEASAFSPPRDEQPFAALRRWWGGHGLSQVLLLAALAALAAFLAHNVIASMHRLGMQRNLAYLTQPAAFDISELLIPYHAGETYARAILVGLLNTLKLAVAGRALATALGLALVWPASAAARSPLTPSKRTSRSCAIRRSRCNCSSG